MAQIARNMSMVFAEEKPEYRPTHIIRDRDAKFIPEFCSMLETDGIQFRPIPPHSPNLNPLSEVWAGRTKAECLNHFIVFGEAHLRHILQQWIGYYHKCCPPQELGNVPIDTDLSPPALRTRFPFENVVCSVRISICVRAAGRWQTALAFCVTALSGWRLCDGITLSRSAT
jgi:putative transposase